MLTVANFDVTACWHPNDAVSWSHQLKHRDLATYFTVPIKCTPMQVMHLQSQPFQAQNLIDLKC